MNTETEANRPESRDGQVAIHMGEYAALRAELISFQGLEYQAIQFAIAAITAIIGLIVQADLAAKDTISIHDYLERHWILLVAPPFWLLGCLFAYAQFKVMLVARYLDQNLRPKLMRIVKSDVLAWEVDRRHHLFRGVKLLSELFSGVRWLLFVWPLGFLLHNDSWRPLLGPYGRPALLLEQTLFWFLCCLGICCWLWLPRWVVTK